LLDDSAKVHVPRLTMDACDLASVL